VQPVLHKLFIFLMAVLVIVPSAVAGTSSGLAQVKQATQQFRSLGTAKTAGYGILVDAKKIACIDVPGTGGMGVHYVNGKLVGDAAVTAAKPEALVYQPAAGGAMKLVAVEYVVFKAKWDAAHATPPSLFGRPFSLTAKPNRFGLPAFYSLHAWIYKNNPMGTFSPWNPRVTCTA
jgi:hypothetical protein